MQNRILILFGSGEGFLMSSLRTGNFMDGRFAFDYSEYSRKNWAISDICCLLDDILRRIIYMLFYDKDALSSIKGS